MFGVYDPPLHLIWAICCNKVSFVWFKTIYTYILLQWSKIAKSSGIWKRVSCTCALSSCGQTAVNKDVSKQQQKTPWYALSIMLKLQKKKIYKILNDLWEYLKMSRAVRKYVYCKQAVLEITNILV